MAFGSVEGHGPSRHMLTVSVSRVSEQSDYSRIQKFSYIAALCNDIVIPPVICRRADSLQESR